MGREHVDSTTFRCDKDGCDTEATTSGGFPNGWSQETKSEEKETSTTDSEDETRVHVTWVLNKYWYCPDHTR